MASFAVMNIDKGEEIIFALVSGHIPGTGGINSWPKN